MEELNEDIITKVDDFIDNNLLKFAKNNNIFQEGKIFMKDIDLLRKVMKYVFRLKGFNKAANKLLKMFKNDIINSKIKIFDSNYNDLTKRNKKLSLQGKIESYIAQYNGVIKTHIIKYTNKDIDKLRILINNLNEPILNGYNKIIMSFFENHNLLDYNKKSMVRVSNVKLQRLYGENTIKYSIEYKLNELQKYVELKNVLKSDNKKINKFSISSESKLIDILSNIVNNKELSPELRQISVEKTILEYDMNWFNLNFSNSTDIRSIILHDVYKKILRKLNNLIKIFTANNFELLNILFVPFRVRNNTENVDIFKSMFDQEGNNIPHPRREVENTAYRKKNEGGIGNIIKRNGIEELSGPEKNKAITGLVIIYLGPEILLSLCFSEIVKLLTQFTTSEEELGKNRTELIFNIANKLFKVAISFSQYPAMAKEGEKLKNNSILPRKKVLDRLNKYLNQEEIINIFRNRTEMDNFYLGDTILNLILNDCDIFKLDVVNTEKKNKEILISIKDEYRHKLVTSSINITQIPMLVPANSPSETGMYFPYLLPEISHIYNPFDTVIKNKHDNLIPTRNQESIIDTINFLNNVKFKINKKVFYFIVKEWEDDNSKIFKGYNKLKEIKITDSKQVKKEKLRHNSIYWNYYNAIAVAYIYYDEVFYIPTFADFRGRIYPLLNYLSYQGDDLNRALLLFADIDENINDAGIEVMMAYFANLAGKSKESWKDKIEWAYNNFNLILNDFYQDKEKFDNFIDSLSEPFQFLSIMWAVEELTMAHHEGKRYIPENPILFDATCNGIQHLSALTREFELALKVNLVSNSDKIMEEIPQDFYRYCSELIKIELEKSPNE